MYVFSWVVCFIHTHNQSECENNFMKNIFQYKLILAHNDSFFEYFKNFQSISISKMDNLCHFKLCTSAVHGSQCYGTMEKYFSQKFNGVMYIVCPFCVSYSTGSFSQFLEVHQGHLNCFPKTKLLVLKDGKIIFVIFYILLHIFSNC